MDVSSSYFRISARIMVTKITHNRHGSTNLVPKTGDRIDSLRMSIDGSHQSHSPSFASRTLTCACSFFVASSPKRFNLGRCSSWWHNVVEEVALQNQKSWAVQDKERSS